MLLEIRMGLEKPKTAEEINKVQDCNGMREAIQRGRYDSNLIQSCLIRAEMAGLSGEDKYVLLAYRALIELETAWRRLEHMINISPNPGLIMHADPTTEGSKP